MATAVSGTGPTYVFLVMEALIDAAVHLGFPRHIAHDLVIETLEGSTLFAKSSGMHPAQLRNMVTSPGGTSAAALHELESGRLRTVLSEAVWAAYRRTEELGRKLEADTAELKRLARHWHRALPRCRRRRVPASPSLLAALRGAELPRPARPSSRRPRRRRRRPLRRRHRAAAAACAHADGRADPAHADRTATGRRPRLDADPHRLLAVAARRRRPSCVDGDGTGRLRERLTRHVGDDRRDCRGADRPRWVRHGPGAVDIVDEMRYFTGPDVLDDRAALRRGHYWYVGQRLAHWHPRAVLRARRGVLDTHRLPVARLDRLHRRGHAARSTGLPGPVGAASRTTSSPGRATRGQPALPEERPGDRGDLTRTSSPAAAPSTDHAY